jgi:ABC-2 type transport system ATP-binding protein
MPITTASMLSACGSTMLSASGVTKAFGDEQALAGVDLDLVPGEIHALVGLNGAGKTTLMRVLLGMLRPDAGQVTATVDGTPIPIDRMPAAAWRGFGHLIETPFAYAELTVTETVRAAARLHGMPTTDAPTVAEAVIAELGLDHWAGRRTRALSLGNRQRVGLACALVHRPGVMVLDEPTNALDPAGVLLVRRRLLRAAESGAAILVSSHHLDEMARIAHRITVLHRGVVTGTLPPGTADLERAFFDMVYAAEGDAPDDDLALDGPTTPRSATPDEQMETHR